MLNFLFNRSNIPQQTNPDHKFFVKENRNDLSKKIPLSDLDINQYYRPMIQLCMAYNESLYYFARADFHQNKYTQHLCRRIVINKLIDIYNNHSNKKVVLKIIGKNEFFIDELSKNNYDHKELVNYLGGVKSGFNFYYSEYQKLQNSLDKIYDKHHLDEVLQTLNNQLIVECSNKNIKDRIDYYLTLDDTQIYNFFVSPIVGFHAILIAFLFPAASATILGTLTANGISIGIGMGKSQAINFLKKIYNVLIRDTKYYNIDAKIIDEKIKIAHTSHDLYEIKKIISQLRQSSLKIGDFNYFLSNSFKYYVKTKEELNKLSIDYLENKKIFKDCSFEEEYLLFEEFNSLKKEYFKNEESFIEYIDKKENLKYLFKTKRLFEKYPLIDKIINYQNKKMHLKYLENKKFIKESIIIKEYLINKKEYESIIFNKKYLYYKTMNYYRSKNILENTLKVQIDSIKLITSKSMLMLRGNRSFKIFLDNFKNKYNDIKVKAKITEIILQLGGQSHFKEFTDLVMISLINEKIEIGIDKLIEQNITLNPKTTFGDDILKFSDNFGGTADFINQVTKILSNIPGTDTYFSELTKHSKEFDWGLWLSLNALDGILYLTETSSAMQKYQKISSYIKKISSFFTLGNYALGVINLVGQNWTHLFSSPFITKFSLNPFSIFTSLLSIKISKSVSSNYTGIWNDICSEFENYKKNYHKVPATPAFDYFVSHRKSDPCESIHKISDIFKGKMSSIISSIEEVNNSSITFLEKVGEFNSIPKNTNHPEVLLGKYAYFVSKKVITENEILTDYIKILLSLFSLAKELESYDHFLNFLKDLNLEIEDFLKLHFALLSVEDKGVFSLFNFGSNSCIYNKIFFT